MDNPVRKRPEYEPLSKDMYTKMVRRSAEYDLIYQYYRDRAAERSGVPLMQHIDDGIEILRSAGCEVTTALAFAIHPLVQDDQVLQEHIEALRTQCRPSVLIYAMEYRSVANAYLSHCKIDDIEEIRVSPLAEVNWMLVADKLQNFRDFMKYHANTHERALELAGYFFNWKDRLSIHDPEIRAFFHKQPEF